MSETIDCEIPEKLLPLLTERHRYKSIRGGRGSGKSVGVAKSLITRALEGPTRVLCAREFQASMAESVHRTLADEIGNMNAGLYFDVQNTVIKGVNGSFFGFEGLKRNIQSIKSYANVDVCWVEEAQVVSDASWEVLIPTIRNEGSEIWLSWNPELEDDATSKRFLLNPPADCLDIELNWTDNPWFPDVLRREMEDLKARDQDAWLHVWEGKFRQVLEGAVYASELRKADEESRITEVPHYAGKPVDTFWDLGYRDSTAIWMIQKVGAQTRVIDYIEGSQQAIGDYVQQLQARSYVWGTDYLPHDADAKELGQGRSLREQVEGLGRKVQIVPRTPSISVGIEALRSVFGELWFDRAKCAVGINHLRRYRYVKNSTGVTGREPLHDQSSHAADALRMFGQMSQNLASAGVWAKVPQVRRRVF